MTSPSIDEVVAQLEARVAERRAAGDYPPGLEEQLEAHFSKMLRALYDTNAATQSLAAHVNSVALVLDGMSHRVETGSRIPGGSAVHRAAAVLVRRQSQHIIGQVSALGAAIHAVLDETRRYLDAQRVGDDRETMMMLSAVMDRLAVLDHLAEMVTDLETRVIALERSAG